MRSITECRVFIASPRRLDDVRQAFREELAHYNQMDAVRRGITFTAVGWEETLGGHRRAQSLINDDLKTCDAFVLVLHDRWGTPPDVEGPYTSGCHEEFELAKSYLADPEQPMADLLVFFQGVEPGQLADPGPQLAQVLDFRQQLESSKQHLLTIFDEIEAFKRRMREHLASWVYAHEQDRQLGPSRPEPIQAFSETSNDDESTTLTELNEAVRLAEEGKLTQAETLFARATVGRDLPDAFNRYGHFLKRLGRLGQAVVMYQRVLSLSDSGGKWKAIAYANLGLIYQTRGELERAEDMHRQALEINEQLGRREGIAAAYGNLGLIYKTRGELERARDAWNRSEALFSEAGVKRSVEQVEGWLAELSE